MFVQAFGFRAAHIIARIVWKRDVERKSWNSLLIEIFRASMAHAQYQLVRNFALAITSDEKLKERPALLQVMTQCFELFGEHSNSVMAD
jgi:acyl-CoA oxidase